MEHQTNKQKEKHYLRIIRWVTLFYIFALFFWGVTAFPLQTEISILCNVLGISPELPVNNYSEFNAWIATVAKGLIETNKNFPFLAYGTDWLAFSHLVIAVAFIGLYVKPVRNKWIIYFGTIACIGVIPLALICGQIRSIPFWWRIIDTSFCLFGLIPLYVLHIYVNKLEKLIGYIPSKY